MTPAPLAAYRALVKSGRLAPDDAQERVAQRLQALHDSLSAMKPRLLRLPFTAKADPPQGLYLWGSVGRGKSMLMDLFFRSAPVKRKRRVHFHAFMQEVHAGLHRLRKAGVEDVVQELAKEISHTRLLCFDELQAADVTDASLLHRLFEGLFAAGVVVVATSNRPPKELYTGEVQKERFAKFICLIEERMGVITLDSPKDYRLEKAPSLERRYYSPLDGGAEVFVAEALESLAPGDAGRMETLAVHGRQLQLRARGKAALAGFDELCEKALGPADFLSIAQAFEALILTDIPVLTPELRNEAKRFVTLIDALYEQKTRLVCTAAAPPDSLYPEGHGSFEFRRTASRLHEMQSDAYWEGRQ